ncbi:sucrose-phosphate synthase [Flavobacterium nitrogenifigens]|uniref:sucrose-phosphate synthase n=2 Tax=Flavobacterium TaxID=237 RepID=A0A7W7NAJ4_9FLAO|nr:MULTISPECIES: HAD-IIB family hydrolase [Flavobacterium]MBB4804616.1 sucrose-phosphate synthase [Flavobacterium nitrogenifigens]MBB6389575.1 sucrose-phosphate synthase [Flavobacterium notoginsengisoli]
MMKKLRISLINIHGLLKGSGLEIGRDADNGGQTKYIYELAEFLSQHEDVEHVHLFTRLIDDPALSREYAVPVEIINDKLDIRRIPFLGKRYKAKEQLWEGLDTFVNGAMQHIKQHNIFPDWIHSHYADAGYAAAELSAVLNIPFAHTGHSLGFYKKKKLLEGGENEEDLEKKFKFKARIAAEEKTLELAEFVVTSTEQEIETYKAYKNFELGKYHAISPGIDTRKFVPYYFQENDSDKNREEQQRKYWVQESISKFLTNPHKPIILALSRPDRHKNLNTLIEVYGKDKELQSLANLVIFAGIRKDIAKMPESEKNVLTDLLLLMDKYDLYGKMAIPKKHDVENEVSIIYRYAAEKRGVFVNLALHENFGLTVIESASSGLPVVVTKNGGPSEIIPVCQNGELVNPQEESQIKKALRNILTDESQWKYYSNNGAINIEKHYSWVSHVNQYVDLINENLSVSAAGIKKQHYPNINVDRLKRKIDHLLVSDIDGTLIEPKLANPGLKELKAHLTNRTDKMAFAMASGRNLELVKKVIDEEEFSLPDFIICSVGTEIYYTNGKDYILDKGWAKFLSGRWKRDEIVNRLKAIKWIKLQEEEAQNPYKISYYYEKEHYDHEELIRVLGNGWYKVNIIPSHGQFLDFIPKRASKGNAIKFLCRKWSIPLGNVIAAGDSGNDVDMFRGPVKGIIVGNRSAELADYETTKSIYVAKNSASEGILEGLKHYKVIK